MPTIADLVLQGSLVQLGGGLDGHEQPERLLYAFPHVVTWLEEVLPSLQPELGDGRQSPTEQLDELFHDFVAGDDFEFYEKAHAMLPTEPGVWELKTVDVRLFGWFNQKGSFIVAEIDTAFRCKQHGLYAGYRGSVVRRRDGLDLDEPKFVNGDYRDVL